MRDFLDHSQFTFRVYNAFSRVVNCIDYFVVKL